MRRSTALLVIVAAALTVAGCAARSWHYEPIESFAPPAATAPAEVCGECHTEQHATWQATAHADAEAMAVVPVAGLQGCGACHEAPGHPGADPEATRPASLAGLTKSAQNHLCGKCHFNIALMDSGAINPEGTHGVFMSVGFDEGKKRQLGCLDCHAGHVERGAMLRTARVHICFDCHKEAIVTMGVFQPFNYIGFGKVCLTCHSEHGGSTASQAGRMALGTAALCIVCHIP